MADEPGTDGQEQEQEQEQETQTFSQAEVDEAVKTAMAGQDRFVASIQKGEELPQWAKDAGVDSVDKALAAISSQAQTAETETLVEFDEAPYLDENDRMTAEGRKAEREYMADVARRESRTAFTEHQREVATADEAAYLRAAGDTASELLLPDPADAKYVTAAVDGLVSRTVKGIASQEQVLEARTQFEGYVNRAADAEIARRALKAKDEKETEAPAGSPGAGDGQPRDTGQDNNPPKTHQEAIARAREKSRQHNAARGG